MDTPTPKLFSLPDRKTLEVFTVKLPNGTTVMRTAAAEGRREVMNPRRFVITGLPNTGKSSFVTLWRRDGDIVWDFDIVMKAVTGIGRHAPAPLFVMLMTMMRSAVLNWLVDHEDHVCYVIVSDAITARQVARQISARLLTMPEDFDVVP
jgi:hypothetical protein